MKDETERTFFITGFFLFLISMILPAFSEQYNFYGFQTAIIALIAPFSSGWDSNVFYELFFRSHLLLLGLHNIILPVTMFMFHKIRSGAYKWLAVLFLISFLNTILFFFLNWFSADHEKLLMGYYVWVSASLLILFPVAATSKLLVLANSKASAEN
jgi:hypothetical protein